MSDDGSFEIDIARLIHDKYVFVLADADQSNNIDKLSNFLTIQDSDGETLTIIKTSDIAADINLLNFSIAGDEAVSGANLSDISASFGTLDYSSLSGIAKIDNAAKVVTNFWRNYDPITDEIYEVNMFRRLMYNSDKEDFINKFVDPTSKNYSLDTNTELNFRTNNGTGNAKHLKCPDDTTVDMGISHDGETYYSYYCNINSDKTEQAGDWQLISTGNEVLAEADFTYNTKIASNSLPVGFIPAIKVHVDDSNIVESIEVKWYYNSEDGVMTEESDLEIVSSLVLGAFIQYNGGGSGYPESGGAFEFDINNHSNIFEYGSNDMKLEDLTSLEFKYSIMGMLYETALW